MKFFKVLVFLFCGPVSGKEPPRKGAVVIESLASESLKNKFGEKATREVAVYLPVGYHESDRRYPVINFLHGFNGSHEILESMSGLLDSAIKKAKIRPFIMVVSNQKTSYGGSFYSNSGVFGNWEDFTASEVVSFVDEKYRTIAKKDARGIAGHSMGGYGALQLAFKHPDRFACVYALSPGALAIVKEYGPDSDTYRELAGIKTMEELNASYYAKVAVAFGKSWSPDPENPPFFCKVPFSYEDGELVVDEVILKKWKGNMPFYTVEENVEKLKQLKAIKLDWGRNAEERFTLQCRMFSEKLEKLGVNHFAEEYIGDHGSGIFTEEGRLPNQLLPFFNDYLTFEEEKGR